MVNQNEIERLVEHLYELREKYNASQSSDDLMLLKKQESICFEKLKYMVYMKANRYKTFSNYNDLVQEGMEVLIKALRNYDPKKGSVYWWIHKYTATRIARCANLHTTIRYPLKIAKSVAPHRENIMPLIIDPTNPEQDFDLEETIKLIEGAMIHLNDESKKIITMIYGLDGEKPVSVSKVCKDLNISRSSCMNIINSALSVMKNNINI